MINTIQQILAITRDILIIGTMVYVYVDEFKKKYMTGSEFK